jgi:hypothetical protein
MDLGKYDLGDFFAESYPVCLLAPLPLTAQQNIKIKTAAFITKSCKHHMKISESEIYSSRL